MLNNSLIFDSSDISYILKLVLLEYPTDSLIDCILAEANPGSATISYVKSFLSVTVLSDSVTPAALEETKTGQPSFTSD